jgi:hypothetical protein
MIMELSLWFRFDLWNRHRFLIGQSYQSRTMSEYLLFRSCNGISTLGVDEVADSEARGCRLNNETFRTAIAAGCVMGAIVIHFTGSVVFTVGVILWLLLAMGAGYMRPSGWMLLLAPVPWILGVGGGMLAGQHDSLGEVWLLPFLLSTAAGVIGIIFGVAARKGNTRAKLERQGR